jgi:hypothetical protein
MTETRQMSEPNQTPHQTPTPVPQFDSQFAVVRADSRLDSHSRISSSRVLSIRENRELHPTNQPHRYAPTRRPQHRTCPTCQETIITGLDAHRAALTVTLDPYPLTPTGEVWALTHHRRTYQITQNEIEPRTRWNIPGHPPSPTLTVLTAHACHQPIPHQHRRQEPPPKPRPTTIPDIRF